MQRHYFARSFVAAAFVLCASIASAGVLVPIPSVPNSTATFVRTINNKNIVAGRYTTSDGTTHAFFGSLDGNYTTFDALDGQTFAEGLNDAGYITGDSNVPNQDCQVFGCEFLRTPDGTIKEITRHKKPLDGFPVQIISHQKFVGQYSYIDQNDNLFFYGYYGQNAKYVSDLTIPFNTMRTRPRGYAEDGTVSGWFSDSDQHKGRGFVLSNGTVTAYDYPDQNAVFTEFEGLNKHGLIPGAWLDANQTFSRAFVFDVARNRFKPIDVAGATYAFGGGINNAGVMTVIDDTSSYIYCPSKKTCPLHSPNAKEIPEHWISAAKFSHTLPCKNGCIGPNHGNNGAGHDPVATRAAIARDPELQREINGR
jgi:hypothetical protein